MLTVPKDASRVIGYDVARALAMLAMIVVHFSLVAAADRSEPACLAGVLSLLDGRATANFVVLAGIGITLMSQRAIASGDPSALAAVRRTCVRRGLFLLVVGFLDLTIWAGDILRVYGVSLLLASGLITSSSRRLLSVSIVIALSFVVLVIFGDFDRNWDWQVLTYHNLWTPAGVFRNLFYDGFRSVFPWTGMLLFGMWLGRIDLTDRQTGLRVFLVGALVAITAEMMSHLLLFYFVDHSTEGLDAETIEVVFGTGSMPALPLFLLAAGGTATAVIALSVLITCAYPSWFWKPWTAVGQLALTWYVVHIVFGLGTLVALNIVGTESLPVAAGYGVIFFSAAMVLSFVWKMRFRYGPLEWVMRAVTG